MTPVQIAYAVSDVAVAASEWVDRGVGPFFVRQHIELRSSVVDGTTCHFDHSSAFAQWGSVMVELICQHDTDAPRIVGTSGVHHLACFVDDVVAAGRALVDSGHREVLLAQTHGDIQFGFYDATASMGHLIEIYEPTPPLKAFYDMVRDAAIGWDGADPVRVLSG